MNDRIEGKMNHGWEMMMKRLDEEGMDRLPRRH